MGDGIVNKFAIIIQDSPDERHQRNAEMSVDFLEPQGFETFVASNAEVANADHNVAPTRENIRQQIEEIIEGRRIDDDDELLVYFTGYGTDEGICLGEDCATQDIFQQIDGIPYGQRIIIMAQSFGGNWADIFLDDPRTIFISGGSAGEIADSQFSPLFWSYGPFHGCGAAYPWENRLTHTVRDMFERGTYSFPRFFATEGVAVRPRIDDDFPAHFVGHSEQTPAERIDLLVAQLSNAFEEVRLGTLRSLDFIIGRGINYELIEGIDLAQIAQAIVPLFDDPNFDVRRAAFVTYQVVAEKSGTIGETERMVTLGEHFGVYSEEVAENEGVMLELVTKNGMLLQYASDENKKKFGIVLAAVRQNANAIQFAPEFWGDRAVMLEVVRSSRSMDLIFAFASRNLLQSQHFMSEAWDAYWEVQGGQLPRAQTVLDVLPPPELRGNAEAMLEAARQDGFVLGYASQELWHNREFVLEAVKIWPAALQFAPEEFRHDREIVLEALKRNGYMLAHAAEEFRGNREIVIEAVRGAMKFNPDGDAINRLVIPAISEELRGDATFMEEVQAIIAE